MTVVWIAVREAVPWLSSAVPYFVPGQECARLIAELEVAGFDVRQIDGRELKDEQSLLRGFGTALSFPDYYGHNWDAFVDCAGDLAESADGPVAVIWTGADHLAAVDLHAFTRAIHLVLSTAEDLASSEMKFQMELFIVGAW